MWFFYTCRLYFMKYVNTSKRNINGALSEEIVFLGSSGFQLYCIGVLLLNSCFLYRSRSYRSFWRNRWTHFVIPVPFFREVKYSRDHNFICTLTSEPIDRFLRYVAFNVIQLEVTFNAVCYSQYWQHDLTKRCRRLVMFFAFMWCRFRYWPEDWLSWLDCWVVFR
jgi:hypothetical protein